MIGERTSELASELSLTKETAVRIKRKLLQREHRTYRVARLAQPKMEHRLNVAYYPPNCYQTSQMLLAIEYCVFDAIWLTGNSKCKSVDLKQLCCLSMRVLETEKGIWWSAVPRPSKLGSAEHRKSTKSSGEKGPIQYMQTGDYAVRITQTSWRPGVSAMGKHRSTKCLLPIGESGGPWQPHSLTMRIRACLPD